MENTAYGWAAIEKVEDQPDGTVIVHGVMTSASLDRDQQRFSQPFLDRAVPLWFNESGNIREQHDGKKAAGSALAVKRDDQGQWQLAAHVVDAEAVKKVKHRVYKGFSIGVKDPHITYGKNDSPGGEIDGGFICETSLVDRPSNPDSLFTMVKADVPDQPIVVNELVEKAIVHAPKGASNGGQFLAGSSGQGSMGGGAGDQPKLEANNYTPKKKAGAGRGKGSAKVKKTPGMSYDPGSGKGTSGPEVKSLQAALAKLHITSNDGQPIKADGQYGPKTQQAVNKLQQAMGLKANGHVTPAFLARVLRLQTLPIPKVRKPKTPVRKADEMPQDETPDLFKYVSADSRKEMANSGSAMPNGDFPIADVNHLRAAIGLLSSYKGDKAAAKNHIVKRAKALGQESMVASLEKADDTVYELLSVFLGGEAFIPKADAAGDAGNEDDDSSNDQTGDDEDDETDDEGDAGKADTFAVLQKVWAADVATIVKADLGATITAAVVEATKADGERIKALEAELAKVNALPEPGGPVQTRTGAQVAGARQTEVRQIQETINGLLEKADDARRSDPTLVKGYLDRADKLKATLAG